jgi:hypothetical protein
MDKSKEYVRMCEEAEEIQKLRDYKNPFSGSAIAMRAGGNFIFYKDKKVVWLPRQDQLQEMVKLERENNYFLLDRFNSFVQTVSISQNLLLKSLEQLWLAFVMKEKYNKVWEGGKWTKAVQR